MARITKFRKAPQPDGRPQPTGVECEWKAFDYAGERYLQLDTFGSAGRANPGKQSQTIQLDRATAEELLAVLGRAFPGLR